jgi:RNA polymerase sigma-B factor
MPGQITLPAAQRPRVAATDALFKHLRATGDPAAREELLKRFLPLARKLAGRYINPYEPIDDQVQVASLGLLAAIDRFDPDRGSAFTSFAVPTILGELKRYFRASWSVHVPRSAQELALRVIAASRHITAETGRSPSVPEIAQFLELSTEDVLSGLEAAEAHYATSLQAPAKRPEPDSDSESLQETLGVEDDRIALVETTASLSAAVRNLPFCEREALRLRVVEDLKQTEIARRMGCSQMQVSRLLRRAATKTRGLLEADGHGTGKDV